ncbi:alanine--tRNA ligase, partial [Vibrio parahaemolyticus VPTS-2010]
TPRCYGGRCSSERR